MLMRNSEQDEKMQKRISPELKKRQENFFNVTVKKFFDVRKFETCGFQRGQSTRQAQGCAPPFSRFRELLNLYRNNQRNANAKNRLPRSGSYDDINRRKKRTSKLRIRPLRKEKKGNFQFFQCLCGFS